MDFGAIGAAVTSLRTAGDIAKGLISLNTMTEVQSKAIELNEKIIDAQHRIFEANAAQSSLVERVRELEGQIAAMKDWDAQKKRYKLATPYGGVTVYALQKSMSDGEPPHYICANCYQNSRRSMLGQSGHKEGWVVLSCAACKFSAQTVYRRIGPAKYAEDIAGPE